MAQAVERNVSGDCTSDECMDMNLEETAPTTNICAIALPMGNTTSTSSQELRQDLKTNMLDRVAQSDGHFKHQQRGETDLTYNEKLLIARDLLENKPCTFLSRYSKYLNAEDIAYFEKFRSDYTVEFYITEIQKRQDNSKSRTKIRNRRYEAMKQLMDSGEYFSDRETKSRDPLLYEQMVGQYLSDDELQTQVEENDGSIASVLMQHIETIHNNELYAKQVDQQECQMEEDVASEEEEEHIDDDSEESELEDEELEEKPSITSQEKSVLRSEFMATMQQRFLSGQDNDFDYSTVDDNVEYDSLDIRTQDEEEVYFDGESECDDEDDLKDRLQSCKVELCPSLSTSGAETNTHVTCGAVTDDAQMGNKETISDPT